MEKRLACGQYLVCIQGSSSLLDSFEIRGEYRTASESGCPAAVLRLESGLEAGGEAYRDGWLLLSRGGLSEVVNYQKGRPVFSLAYGGLQTEVTVRTGSEDGRYIRIGVQYGLMLALHRECLGLHGVTLLCGDKIVILSAPSGTGKTTLAHLLETCCDAIVLNGDFALLSLSADGVIFEPTPFCGSSGRCLNHRVRVDRVVFLSQGRVNEWHELAGREALKQFMANVFIPDWDDKMRLTIQENVIKCVSSLKADAFSFAPTGKAAEMFSNHLRL